MFIGHPQIEIMQKFEKTNKTTKKLTNDKTNTIINLNKNIIRLTEMNRNILPTKKSKILFENKSKKSKKRTKLNNDFEKPKRRK